jgi:hypothetical protein
MEYLYFTFDGISSEVYNIIIQNKGEDLFYPSQPNFENQLVSPLYQGTNYLAGVNTTARVFDFNCWADSLTRKQIIDLMNWLTPNKVGYLVTDYNPDFKYKVKINTLTPLKHIPFNEDDTVNYEFTVSFISVDDFAAISQDSFTTTLGSGPDDFEIGYIIGADKYFYNFYNLPFFPSFTITSASSFTISKDNIVYYSYPIAGVFTLDSRYGFCKDINRDLIELLLEETDVSTNKGPMPISPKYEYVDGIVTLSDIYIDRTLDNYDRIVALENQGVYNKNNLYQAVLQNNWTEGQVVKLKIVKATKLTLTAPSGTIGYSFKYRDNF